MQKVLNQGICRVASKKRLPSEDAPWLRRVAFTCCLVTWQWALSCRAHEHAMQIGVEAKLPLTSNIPGSLYLHRFVPTQLSLNSLQDLDTLWPCGGSFLEGECARLCGSCHTGTHGMQTKTLCDPSGNVQVCLAEMLHRSVHAKSVFAASALPHMSQFSKPHPSTNAASHSQCPTFGTP